MSSITNFKVAFGGLLIGEETEEHTKYLTQKAFKELLEKGGAHLCAKVSACHVLRPCPETVIIRDPSSYGMRFCSMFTPMAFFNSVSADEGVVLTPRVYALSSMGLRFPLPLPFVVRCADAFCSQRPM
jgi:hypothetical protein